MFVTVWKLSRRQLPIIVQSVQVLVALKKCFLAGCRSSGCIVVCIFVVQKL